MNKQTMLAPPPSENSRADSAVWHAATAAETLHRLDSNRTGLSWREAKTRQRTYGPNILPRAPLPSAFRRFLIQFKNPLIYLLLGAAAVSLAIGEPIDAAFIFFVLLTNALIGTYQEWRAANEAESLRSLIKTWAVVRRDGQRHRLAAADLVPGDVVLLESGLHVPADARLIDQFDLELDESLLTGESTPVAKDADTTCDTETPIGDRANMLHAGTVVLAGRGIAVVTEIGRSTQIGRLSEVLRKAVQVSPPLIVRMRHFARVIAVSMVGVIAALAVIELARGLPPVEVFLVAVALAVAAIPEGLPVALTVALSIAVHRMARRNVVVRLLPAVEGLGACTLIASDKTGTLTCNELTIRKLMLRNLEPIDVSGEGYSVRGSASHDDKPLSEQQRSAAEQLAVSGALCNEASIQEADDGAVRYVGDTVDVGFLILARKLGLNLEALQRRYESVGSIPYESGNRFAAAFVRSDGTITAHVKGAVETVLPMCAETERSEILSNAERLANRGYRVLAVASGPVETTASEQPKRSDLRNLTLCGLVGLIDPLRPEAASAIRYCRDAGIEVNMITGDHPATALAIARELGLADQPQDVITGRELADLAADPGALDRQIGAARVFARVEPLQKLMIVESLRRLGHIVAVTGDGANDAPALKAADIGVAMGQGGTDIARDAADLVLTDDNFASIVDGVEQGRIAYDNIRKVIYMLISTSAAEIALFMLTIGFGLPLPLRPLQLLWLNLVTQGIQHVALALERGEPGVLARSPRPATQGIFDRRMVEQTVLSGLFGGGAGFVLFAWTLGSGVEPIAASNIVLLFFVLFENAHMFNCRSEIRSTFRISLLHNKPFVFAVAAAAALHVVAMHTPVGQIIGASPVDSATWLVVVPLAGSVLLVMEAYKLVRGTV